MLIVVSFLILCLAFLSCHMEKVLYPVVIPFGLNICIHKTSDYDVLSFISTTYKLAYLIPLYVNAIHHLHDPSLRISLTMHSPVTRI